MRIQTYTGKMVDPTNLKVDDIDIVDIAHALSNKCRFGCHCRVFYSVAEHSLRLSYHPELPSEHALWGLLHDAAEAYIGDVTTPLKQKLRLRSENVGLDELEQEILGTIASCYDLQPLGMPQIVNTVDQHMYATEAADLMTVDMSRWATGVANEERISRTYWPTAAKDKFLERFYDLMEDKAFAIRSRSEEIGANEQ